ncbi:hypothetical protein E5288_WYG020771 [Bos mutus]|uniref:Uncharacterized protein n=1 Tax=Bos mutus TaxID=72004 RepID=A0A6B0R6A6_9CETA|nr:hypothetical protein [Bos mutus]
MQLGFVLLPRTVHFQEPAEWYPVLRGFRQSPSGSAFPLGEQREDYVVKRTPPSERMRAPSSPPAPTLTPHSLSPGLCQSQAGGRRICFVAGQGHGEVLGSRVNKAVAFVIQASAKERAGPPGNANEGEEADRSPTKFGHQAICSPGPIDSLPRIR